MGYIHNKPFIESLFLECINRNGKVGHSPKRPLSTETTFVYGRNQPKGAMVNELAHAEITSFLHHKQIFGALRVS